MVEVGEGRGWGGMASVASEADRSLAKVFIAVLAGCLLPGGGTFLLKDNCVLFRVRGLIDRC